MKCDLTVRVLTTTPRSPGLLKNFQTRPGSIAEIKAEGTGATVGALFRSDVDAGSIEIDALELRRKGYFAPRYGADFTASLGTSGGGAHGGISFDNVD